MYADACAIEINLLKLLKTQEKNDPDITTAIMRMNEHFVFKDHTCLVFELLGPNMYQILGTVTNYNGFPLPTVSRMIKCVLVGLGALHRLKVTHCDLKPENILCSGETAPTTTTTTCYNIHSVLKIADLGSAHHEHDTEVMSYYAQSRFYRAPEVLLGLWPYTVAVDMWSLGCVAFEFFFGAPLIPATNEHDALARITQLCQAAPNNMIAASSKMSAFYKCSWGKDGIATFPYCLKTAPEYTSDVRRSNLWYNYGPSLVLASYFGERTSIKDIVVAHCENEPTINSYDWQRAFISFLECVLQWDPKQRSTAEDLMMHPFITGDITAVNNTT